MSHSCDDLYDVYDERSQRARKARPCDACGETIAPGQQYTRVGIVFESQGSSVARCVRCQKIHEHLRGLAPGDLWPDEKLNCGETYQDEWGREPPPEIAALAFARPGDAVLKDGEREGQQ